MSYASHVPFYLLYNNIFYFTIFFITFTSTLIHIIYRNHVSETETETETESHLDTENEIVMIIQTREEEMLTTPVVEMKVNYHPIRLIVILVVNTFALKQTAMVVTLAILGTLTLIKIPHAILILT